MASDPDLDLPPDTPDSPGTRELAVRGQTYAVRDTGGSGPAVLLLHGWPDDSTLWRHQQRALADRGYRAVAVDWLGHGGSTRPRDHSRYRVPELAADTVGVLDALGLDRAHLVAHDYGATVSWETVASHPRRFASYTAVSVGHPSEILRDVLAGGLLRYRWLVLHGLDASVQWYLADDARRFRRAFRSHPDADRVLRLLRSPDPFPWTVWEKANPVTDVARRQLSGGGGRLRVPTLGLYSRQDEWMTEGQLARSYRRVDAPWRYEAVAGGHWVPLERPDTVTGPLLAWLADVEAGRLGR